MAKEGHNQPNRAPKIRAENIAVVNFEFFTRLPFLLPTFQLYYKNYLLKKEKANLCEINIKSNENIKKYMENSRNKLRKLENLSENYKLYDDNYNDFVNNVIDVESLIDVVLAQAYASNWDFIGNFNNLKAFASTTIDTKNPYQDGKIRFCLHDADFAFRDTNNVLDINHNNFYGNTWIMYDC